MQETQQFNLTLTQLFSAKNIHRCRRARFVPAECKLDFYSVGLPVQNDNKAVYCIVMDFQWMAKTLQHRRVPSHPKRRPKKSVQKQQEDGKTTVCGAVRGAEKKKPVNSHPALGRTLRQTSKDRQRLEPACLKSGSKWSRLAGFPRSLPSPRSCCQPSVLLALLLLPCHTFLFTSHHQKPSHARTHARDCRTVCAPVFHTFSDYNLLRCGWSHLLPRSFFKDCFSPISSFFM